MRFRAPIIHVVFSVLLLDFAGQPAGAQSFIEVTDCESVSINGQSHGRVTFSVVNQDPTSVIYSFVMSPVGHLAPEDTCHVLQQGFPTNWSGLLVNDGKVYFYSLGDPIEEAGTLAGFQVVLSRTTCCYRFAFSHAFDFPFAFQTVCLECDLATPSKLSTWGEMKAQYR